ncbi:class I SAM-dependent methyltransferase [Halochromatium sp.]
MQTCLLLSHQTASLDMAGINNYAQDLDDADLQRGTHRELIGGLWDEIGDLQYHFLRDQGLKPSMALLDVGCGCLRGGLHFVRYLQPGRYVGADINASLLRAGMLELQHAGLQDRGATLIQTAAFDFRSLGRTFDMAIAVSVFTHLFFNHIGRCLQGIKQVLSDSGVFYATFFTAPSPLHLEPISHQPGGIVTAYDKDPFHCHPQELAQLAAWAGLEAELIGDWAHPRAQQMIAFRHA